MATVDSLLKIVTARSARSLTLMSGQPPSLDRGDGPEPMSMPPLADELLGLLVGEVFNGQWEAASGSAEASYDDPDGNRFTVTGAKLGTGLKLVFTLLEEGAGAYGGKETWKTTERLDDGTGNGSVGSVTAMRPEPQTVAVSPAEHPEELTAAVDNALAYVEGSDVSDLILSAQLGARVRTGGQIQPLAVDLDGDDILSLLSAAPESATAELAATGSCDFALNRRGTRYRVNVFRQHHGIAAAVRPIRTQVPTLSSLRLPDSMRELVGFPHGLVLVTGQAGSGKSTTLIALVEHLNRTAAKHVITLEDPIEFEYTPRQGVVHQREVGTHVSDFATGLRAALRESPDVVLVGEMRDRETIAAALTAAETGHLVLSTLHAASAEMALNRIIDIFPQGQQHQVRAQLSNSLRAILTQFLLPTTRPPERVPAYELLVVNAAVASMIRDGKTHQIQSQIQTGRESGMVPLDRVLRELVKQRTITRETARSIAREPERL